MRFPICSSWTRRSRCSLNDTRVLLHWLHTVIHLHSYSCNQWMARSVSAFSTKVRKQGEEFQLARGFGSWMTVISLSRLYMWTRPLISPAPQQIFCARRCRSGAPALSSIGPDTPEHGRHPLKPSRRDTRLYRLWLWTVSSMTVIYYVHTILYPHANDDPFIYIVALQYTDKTYDFYVQ